MKTRLFLIYTILIVSSFLLISCDGHIGNEPPSANNSLVETENDYPIIPNPHCPAIGSQVINLWETNGDKSKLLKSGSTTFETGAVANVNLIQIEPEVKYQFMEGFGAAITDSTAYLLYNHPDRDNLMQELFNKESGIGINYIRIPLGASDFSRTWYTYDDTPGDLSDFSIDHDREYIIPILKQALQINPDLKIMGSPWTAPGWMKTQNVGTLGLRGGRLEDSMFTTYAQYLSMVLNEYANEGLELHAITLQNEPLHSSAQYPCMFMNPREQAKLITELIPIMERDNSTTKIILYDHNWNEAGYNDSKFYPEEVLQHLNKDLIYKINGSGWHAYNGSAISMGNFHDLREDWHIYFTEITGGEWSTNFADNLIWNFENIFIDGPRNWAKTALLWNIALDETGGPNIRPVSTEPGDHMRGVLTIDSTTNIITREVEYYILAQQAKFVYAGARRIGSTGDLIVSNGTLKNVAYQNRDGSYVLIVSNSSDTETLFNVAIEDKWFNHTLEANSVVTFVW